MSLGILVRGPEGLVFAAESRVTLDWQLSDGSHIPVSFDTASKLLTFGKPHHFIGIVTYGLAGIGNRTAYSFIPELESDLPSGRISVEEFAKKLSNFFMEQWDKIPGLKNYVGGPMVFIIGGFNEKEPYGRAYEVRIPENPTPVEQKGFGLTWGGQREVVDKLIQGYDFRLPQLLSEGLTLTAEQVERIPEIVQPLKIQIPLDAMALQDYIDLAMLLVRTTIETQRLTAGIRGCGGPIDVATITKRDGFHYVQQKELIGERSLK